MLAERACCGWRAVVPWLVALGWGAGCGAGQGAGTTALLARGQVAQTALPCRLSPGGQVQEWSLAAPDGSWQMEVPQGIEVQCAEGHAELRYPGRLHVLMATSRGDLHRVVGELDRALSALAEGYVTRVAAGLPPDAIRVRALRLGTPSRAARVVEIRPRGERSVHVAIFSALPLPQGYVVQAATWGLPAQEYQQQRELVWDLLVGVATSWSTSMASSTPLRAAVASDSPLSRGFAASM